jgi:hypothetical protein
LSEVIASARASTTTRSLPRNLAWLP